MTFQEINSSVVDLRKSLQSFVGKDALGEVFVRPPAGDEDEASFLRLVAWSYCLIFETGRITIPYLLNLPSSRVKGNGTSPQTARTLVHALRTWCFHNLGFDSERDVDLSKIVHRWFLGACEESPPTKCESWKQCFAKLCDEVGCIINHCQDTVTTVLSAPDDGLSAIEALQSRINKSWSSQKFDMLVDDASIRLGIRVDVRKFREPRLSKWREGLESLPDVDDPLAQAIRMIERDLLDHAAQLLPIDGTDIMKTLGIPPGPEVRSALLRAREITKTGVHDPEELLKKLNNELNKSDS